MQQPECNPGRLSGLIFVQLALRFGQACACLFQRLASGALVTLQLAQVGAGEGYICLQGFQFGIHTGAFGAYQLRRRLARGRLRGMQGLFGGGQGSAQWLQCGFVSAGLLGLLKLGAFHRQLDLGLFQDVVTGGFGGWGGRLLFQIGQGLLGFFQLLAQASDFGLLLVVRVLDLFQLAQLCL